MTGRVALVTSAQFAHLDEDMPALQGALTAHGLDGEPAVWDDQTVDWASYDLVVVRSTWDYAERRDEFVELAAGVAAATRLYNPAGVLRWNTDKRYLRDLEAAGLPVVRT